MDSEDDAPKQHRPQQHTQPNPKTSIRNHEFSPAAITSYLNECSAERNDFFKQVYALVEQRKGSAPKDNPPRIVPWQWSVDACGMRR